MARAVEAIAAGDPQRRASDAFDLRAHRRQAAGEIADLGLARGVLEDRLAAGERGGEEEVLGRAHRDLREDVAGPDEPAPGVGTDLAALDLDRGPPRLQPLEEV